MKLLSFFAALGTLGFLLALFTAQHGCASDCGNNCPATTVYIGSPDNAELDAAFDVDGPACPPRDSVTCTGDMTSTYCTHTTITGQAASWCNVLVAFDPYNDGRPWQIIHLEFGPPENASGTCCKGYPVLGPSTYVIPDHPQSGGVYATNADGSAKDYDAITTLHDASADGASDGGADGGAADALSGG
jgi:hypothetical protein